MKKQESTRIHYGIQPSPFGPCLIGAIDGKICKVSFLDKPSSSKAEGELRKLWPKAELMHDDKTIKPFIAKLFGPAKGKKSIPFILKGTPFQIKVWKALMAIPEGKTKTYKEVARAIGSPKAFRAVGSACGKNPIGMLIPCHRVLASDGSLGGFGWGLDRKESMLAWEATQTSKK